MNEIDKHLIVLSALLNTDETVGGETAARAVDGALDLLAKYREMLVSTGQYKLVRGDVVEA